MVNIGKLTIPTDFHVIRPTEGDKGGRPQVLLGRPFLKTARFKLQYDNDTFSLSVGNISEIFHVTRPPAPQKKGAHQLRVSTKKIGPEKLLGSKKEKEVENSKNNASVKKGSRIAPPSLKKDGTKESSKPAKKKKQHEEVKTRKKKKHEEDVDAGGIALKGLMRMHLRSSFHYAKLNYSIVKGEELCSPGMRANVRRDKPTIEFDPEIKKTLKKNRSRVKAQRSLQFEQQEANSDKCASEKFSEEEIVEENSEEEIRDNMADNANNQRRTLADYTNPTTASSGSSIVWPTVDANNFELKPALV
ncbi:hypothetical protein PIB30_076507 [Stylosanthes scabra]|uniref:Uncharacterized protein n=1 Tax=Stylosanthes scabra TaxID=79078 RepID=A0ABU6QQP3_9FABA|nr:hypothetical protein [Stylosanthes scabra]